LSNRIGEGEYELMPYQPFAVVPWYAHMAAPGNTTKPAEWPKADYEVSLENFRMRDRCLFADVALYSRSRQGR
jgi:hypothetical protein